MKRVILLMILLCTSIFSINPVSASYEAADFTASNAVIKVNGDIVSLLSGPVEVKGTVLVPASEVFSKLGVSVNWYPGSGRIKMSGNGVNVSMRLGDRNAFINGERKGMDAAPVLRDGKVLVPVKSAAEGLKTKINVDGNVISLGNANKWAKYVVVIDAGHGGKDPGAVAGGIQEKDLNLDMAVRLNKLLKAEGVKTYMTREDDRFIELYDRSGLANQVNADLLISIHNNAAGNTNTMGSMSLYYPGGGNSNGRLTASGFAAIVQNNLIRSLKTSDLGEISRPNLAVLRTAKMPAVIAEVGYMTNSKELLKLTSASYRQSAAESLKNAVLEALGKI